MFHITNTAAKDSKQPKLHIPARRVVRRLDSASSPSRKVASRLGSSVSSIPNRTIPNRENHEEDEPENILPKPCLEPAQVFQLYIKPANLLKQVP